MTASIPQDKIDKALARIQIVASAARIEPKPMEELIGILQWIGQVLVRAGVHLPFAICTLKAAYKFGKATVSVALRRELEWWKQLLLQWNGTALIIDPVWIIPAHGSNDAPFTDASSDDNVGGGGGIFQKSSTLASGTLVNAKRSRYTSWKVSCTPCGCSGFAITSHRSWPASASSPDATTCHSAKPWLEAGPRTQSSTGYSSASTPFSPFIHLKSVSTT
jgi:hypothetical protein